MIITVDRITSNHDVTISRVYVNGKFFCHGLEQEYDPNNTPNNSRIPAGTYRLRARRFGGFHKRYSEMFDFHKGMIEVIGVPGRSDILIHVGNYHTDTKGCPLVGVADFKAWTVWQSKATYERFYKEVIDKVWRGQAAITFKDSDR